MIKKFSRRQKAWVTRKANAKKKQKHKIIKGLEEALKDNPWKVSENQVEKTLGIRFPSDFKVTDSNDLKEAQKAINELHSKTYTYTPAASIETTMISLERSIDSLIQRITAQTQRIKDMM